MLRVVGERSWSPGGRDSEDPRGGDALSRSYSAGVKSTAPPWIRGGGEWTDDHGRERKNWRKRTAIG